MNKQKQILVLIIIIIIAVLVWVLYFRGGAKVEAPQKAHPVAEDTGKFIPKLNNTLETSVTVVNPADMPAGQPQ